MFFVQSHISHIPTNSKHKIFQLLKLWENPQLRIKLELFTCDLCGTNVGASPTKVGADRPDLRLPSNLPCSASAKHIAVWFFQSA